MNHRGNQICNTDKYAMSLQTLGLNPFAVTLLAESMLKSAYVKHCGTKPLTFEFPVRRGDCESWAGVRITIEAVPADGVPGTPGGAKHG
jgi:hypothetical protein